MLNKKEVIYFESVNAARMEATRARLPDGFFSDQKSKFWRTLEWKMLLHIMVISNIQVPLCIFYGHFVIV
jgi:hypothetical protein